MKKILGSISIVMLMTAAASAGGAETGRLLDQVGRGNVGTGVLYDLVAPLSGIERFDGSAAAAPATLGDWKQIYHELYRASLEPPAWPGLQPLMRGADRSARAGVIPIGIMNIRYDRLRQATREELRSLERSGGGALSAGGDPCEEHEVFAAAVLRDRTFRGGDLSFVVGREWYVANAGDAYPERIEIDFGDGEGFREVRFDEPVTVGYSSTGEKICRLRALMPDGTALSASFGFDVAALATPSPHDTIHVAATIPYEGQTAGGDAYVYLADPLAGLSNPIVIIEGFDIDNTMFWDELYADLNQQELVERVRAEGFDVVVLNFLDSTDYIQRNSFVVVELLSQIQGMIPPSHDLVLMGASMGGLCGRYALAYMESSGPAHHVRTFVSYDTPNRGADIPLGVQYWVLFFAEQSEAAGEMLAGLESPAARQMLEYHFTDPPGTTGASDPLYGVLQSELAALGGYPVEPRTVAFADGSGHAAGQGFSAGAQIVLYEYSSLLVDITGNVWAVPDGTSRLIFEGLIDMIWPLPDDAMNVTVGGTVPLDNAPGGSRPSMAQMDSTEAPYGDIVALYERHCFIPTISALDLDTDDPFYDVASDPSIMSLTPFDTVYWSEVNEAHVFISPGFADLLLAEARIGVTGDEPELPAADRVALRQNRPNPFNPSTTIEYSLATPGLLSLRIYDAGGRLIRTLVDGKRPAGRHEAIWNGLDDRGRPAASGVYFCRLDAHGMSLARKMVLLR